MLPIILIFFLLWIFILFGVFLVMGYSLLQACGMVVLLFLSYVLGGVMAIGIVILSILLYRPIQNIFSRTHRSRVLAIAYVSFIFWLIIFIMPGNPPGFDLAFLAICILAVLNLKGR